MYICIYVYIYKYIYTTELHEILLHYWNNMKTYFIIFLLREHLHEKPIVERKNECSMILGVQISLLAN